MTMTSNVVTSCELLLRSERVGGKLTMGSTNQYRSRVKGPRPAERGDGLLIHVQSKEHTFSHQARDSKLPWLLQGTQS